jgi:AraC family transcriptional regulator
MLAAADRGIRGARIAAGQSQIYGDVKHTFADHVGQASFAAGWADDVVVERWSLPATEFPEHRIARHRLVVEVGSVPVPAAWTEDGARLREQVIAPRAIQVVPQGSTTRALCRGEFNFAAIEFSSALMRRLLDGHAPADSEMLVLRRNVSDPVAHGLTCQILTELATPTERLYGETLGVALAVHLLERYGRAPVGAKRFKGRLSSVQARRVLEHISANLESRLSVAALAGEAGLSEAHFARAFRATFNEPPHRLVLRMRLERALRLVTTDGLGPAEAAIAAGFCDQAHLTNAMRRHFGVTPGGLTKS